MTRDELEFQANRVIAAAKASLELQSEFPFLTMLHRPGHGWMPYRMPAGTEQLMNSGSAKREIFGFFRQAVQAGQYDAVLFASDTWNGETTDEGMKHVNTAEWDANHDFGFVTLAKLGWVKVHEAITVTVQSEADVLIVSQEYQRRSNCIQLLGCKRQWLKQSEFGGQQKMFGDLSEENLGEHPSDRSNPTPAKT